MSDPKISPTFCPLPWLHLYLHTDGAIFPCCMYREKTGDLKSETLAANWNSEGMKQIRREMLAGKEPKGCDPCFNQERLGSVSYRQHSQQHFKELNAAAVAQATLPDGSLKEFKLQSADFRFSNLCNFKCRSCKSEFSSSIAAEEKLSALATPGPRGQAMQEFAGHYQSLKKIYFAGGEPMLQKEHWQILKDLSSLGRASEIALTYSTNGSLLALKDDSAIEHWKKFKAVSVWFSVDAMGEQAEYWRNGSRWSEIEKNIQAVRDAAKEFPQISYCVKSTLSWPNIHAWIRLVKHFLQNELISHPSHFDFSLVEGPADLCLRSIPDFKKEEIENALEAFKIFLLEYFPENVADEKVRGVINYMRSTGTPEALPGFAHQFSLDHLRNESFFTIFPEHENMRVVLEDACRNQ